MTALRLLKPLQMLVYSQVAYASFLVFAIILSIYHINKQKKTIAPKSTKYYSIDLNTLEEYNDHLEEFD